MILKRVKHLGPAALLAATLFVANQARPTIAADYPYPNTVTAPTPHPFDALLKRLEKAIADNSMGVGGPSQRQSRRRCEYMIENTDKTATMIYRRPSAVFAPYGSDKLDAMARELDPIFEKIVRDAAGQ